MNDAEFCSDAHRQLYGEEQLLAMQRLTENAAPIPRAATKTKGKTKPPAETAPAAEFAESASAGPGMSIVGGPCPMVPASIPGWDLEIPAIPVMSASTVLFRDWQYRLHAEMPKPTGLFPIVLEPRAAEFRSAIIAGQVAALRVVIPRRLASTPRKAGSWKATRSTGVAAVEAPTAVLLENGGTELSPTVTFGSTVPPRRRRQAPQNRQLPLCVTLVPLTLDTAGAAATPRHEEGCFDLLSVVATTGFQYPRSVLKAVTLAEILPPDPITPEEWSTLASSPLGALLAATHYPTVRPMPSAATPADTALPGLDLMPFPALPATNVAGPLCAVAATVLPQVLELHPVVAPQPAPIHGTRKFTTQLLGEASLQFLPSPVRADLRTDLASNTRVLPIGELKTAVTANPPVRDNEWTAVQLDAALPAFGKPSGKNGLARTGVVPVAAPPRANAPFRLAADAVSAEPAGESESVWLLPAVTEQHPSSRVPSAGQHLVRAQRVAHDLRPDAAAGELRGHALSPDRGEEETAWLLPAISGLRPASPLSASKRGMATANRVAHDLSPGAEVGDRPIYGPRSLQTAFKLRMPRHVPGRDSRYATAACVPVAAPQPAPVAWQPRVAASVDLSPAAVLPTNSNPLHPLAPRESKVELFRVPGAQPMARPSDGSPALFSLDSWGGRPLICVLELPWDDGKRRRSFRSARKLGRDLRELLSARGLQDLWSKAGHFPTDLKWIAMVVPLVIGIWVLARPSTPPPVPAAAVTRPAQDIDAQEEVETNLAAVQPVSAPRGSAKSKKPGTTEKAALPATLPVQPVGPWDSFTARIAHRASVDYIEDFRNGLSSWEGRGEWARSWSYDRSGTVRPGHMAIYQPSVGLKDYVMEMKASIERRSIQWMVRAANPQNYHFARLNVTPGAPLTKLELERWTVINGRAGKVTRLPLPHGGANQTLYSLRVEARGDSITTYLQDQVIDTFNDPRLQEGGVGLIGAADDRPRIYGIHIYHQNDFLGKLCSFFAPLPINSQGSD